MTLKEHHLTNARAIISYVNGVDFTEQDHSLFTAIGRARDWGGELTDEELETLSLIVLDFQPDSAAWAEAKAELLTAIEEALLAYEETQ